MEIIICSRIPHIKNVALKFNDMERMLSDMSNLPNVITEFLSLYADANTANLAWLIERQWHW
jgi:hypothetical protein